MTDGFENESLPDFELEELLGMISPDAPADVLFNNVKMREDAARFHELARHAGRAG